MKAARILLSSALGLALFFSSSAVSRMSRPHAENVSSAFEQNKIVTEKAAEAEQAGFDMPEETRAVSFDTAFEQEGLSLSGAVVSFSWAQDVDAYRHLEDAAYRKVSCTFNSSRAYSDAEKLLIARVVYAESRGEIFEGQVAVATVVLNRYESGLYGRSIKSIVFAPNQFAISGKHNSSSLRAVEEALERRGDYPYNMFYFRVSKSKVWRNFVYLTRIGNHSFYTSPD